MSLEVVTYLHLSLQNFWWDVFQMHAHPTCCFDNIKTHEDV